MKDVHGWAFPDVDEFMAGELASDGTYQAPHLRMALQHVKDWRIAVDGGAHVGTWTRLLCAKFQRVIAVEPSPDTFEALTVNMARYGCHAECHQMALSDRPGTVSMVLDGRAAELKNTGARYITDSGVIPCDTIDAWNLPALGFLKLDVEGSEVAALRGAIATIRRCKPVILFENKGFWRRYGEQKMAPQMLLRSIGYQFKAPIGCDQIWGPR